MVAYSSNELISSSEFAKKFGSYLSMIKDASIEKLAILKNNRVEAVLVSKDEYEKMQEALKKQEASEIVSSIGKGLSDIEKGHIYHIDDLWDKLDED